MPPRKRAVPAETRPVDPSPLTFGAAVLLPGGGEALVLSHDGENAVVKVGTGPRSHVRLPLEGLEPVTEADETERHARFRADARRRGEIDA